MSEKKALQCKVVAVGGTHILNLYNSISFLYLSLSLSLTPVPFFVVLFRLETFNLQMVPSVRLVYWLYMWTMSSLPNTYQPFLRPVSILLLLLLFFFGCLFRCLLTSVKCPFSLTPLFFSLMLKNDTLCPRCLWTNAFIWNIGSLTALGLNVTTPVRPQFYGTKNNVYCSSDSNPERNQPTNQSIIATPNEQNTTNEHP